MPQDDQYYKKIKQDDDDQDGGGATGGQTGSIEFVDFLGTGDNAREKLPAYEKDRLLIVHKEANKDHVIKQEEKMRQYQELRDGKRSLQAHREGLMGQGNAERHPILSDAAEFSGSTNDNMNPVPSNNDNVANEKDRKEYQLQFQLQLQNRLQNRNEKRYSPPRLTPGG